MTMKIKEYAADRGISTSAVYQSIKAHKSKMESHIDYAVKPCELDDEAVRILDLARGLNAAPVLIDSELRAENERLKAELLETQKELTEALKTLVVAQNEAKGYLIENRDLQRQIELKSHSETEYVRTIFGLYRKVKRER